MPTTCITPIHLDALYVPPQGLKVAGSFCDFSQLGAHTKAYLGSSLTNAPMSRIKLGGGVHLHWSLPDALTKTPGLPLVQQQALGNVFGPQRGSAIWQSLVKAKWLKEILPARFARVLPVAETAAKAPAGLSTTEFTRLQSILTHGSFPAVPDRWLVARYAKDGTTVEKTWIVESNYQWPGKMTGKDTAGRPLVTNYTTYPTPTSKKSYEHLEFIYLGRAYDTSTPQPSSDQDYLPSILTAVGYGEPTFAAFYPNCRSVFGFHDRDITAANDTRTYRVLGFYSDADLDYYRFFRQEAMASTQGDYPNLQLLEAIREEFRWFIPIKVSSSDVGADNWKLMQQHGWVESSSATASEGLLSTVPLQLANTLGADQVNAEKTIRIKLDQLIASQLPTQSLYYAQVSTALSPNPPSTSVQLAVGDSVTGAMSALLASKISSSQEELVEAYLEARQLEDQLGHEQQDLGPKLEALRHQQGFQAVPGGYIWTIRPQQAPGQRADASKASMATSWGPTWADLLNRLNQQQQKYDHCQAELRKTRQQIYIDWCRYLELDHEFHPQRKKTTLRPPSFSSQTGPGGFSNQSGFGGQGAPQFHKQDNNSVTVNQQKKLSAHKDFISWEIDTLLASTQQEAAQCRSQIEQLHQQLSTLLQAHKGKVSFALQRISAPRFWQPTDPAVLLTGVSANPRYGHDGRQRTDQLLACEPVAFSMGVADLPQAASKITQLQQGLPQHFGFPQDTSAWHPLLLEWSVDVKAAHNNYTGNPDDYRYLPAYLQDNYVLDTFDYKPSGQYATNTASIPFRGRSVLTPAGNKLPRKTFAERLVSDILQMLSRTQPTASTVAGFQQWVAKLTPADPQLQDLVKSRTYPLLDDQSQISDWLTTHLNRRSTGQSVPLVDWYGQQLQVALQANTILQQRPKLQADVGSWLSWVHQQLQLKTTYYQRFQIDETKQSDFFLQNEAATAQVPAFGQWLTQQVGAGAQQAFFQAHTLPANTTQQAYLQQEFNTFLNWYQAQLRPLLHQVVDYLAYRHLCTEQGMAQALGGFNEVLTTLSPTYQLNVADPHAAADDPFVAKVREAVGLDNAYSALADADFAPLRSGQVQFTSLNMVDHFGQVCKLPTAGAKPPLPLISAQEMRSPQAASTVQLRPRLTTPARLNFRWLSRDGLMEMNTHPASNPICGWLLPNNLDNSIMVYDEEGKPLGYIDLGGNWRLFPGQASPAQASDISNTYLQRVVQRLLAAARTEANYVTDLISVLDTAIDQIHPQNSAQHDALALYISQPLAVVRAAIQLEHLGGAPNNQSKRIFEKDLGRFTDAQKAANKQLPATAFARNTYGLDELRIPVRLGEYRQLDDGLVGYWIDVTPDGKAPAQDIFFAPQSFDPQKNQHPALIKTHDAQGSAFWSELTFQQAKPMEVSMLVVPNGQVHASCGLLPAKSITLPPDQYREALQRIAVTFLTAPLLSLPDQLHLSLPNEPGLDWAWVEKGEHGWKTISTIGHLREVDFRALVASDSQAATLWQELLGKGWLKKADADLATVVVPDERKDQQLSDTFKPLRMGVEALLAASQINPFDPTAAFSGRPEIREGWLKLSNQ